MKKVQYLLIFILFLLLLTKLSAQQGSLQEDEDFHFAMQLQDKGMNDLAAQQFLKFTENYPGSINSPQAYFNAGQNLEKIDSLSAAANIYLQLLMQYPQSALTDQALLKRGNLLFKLGEPLNAALTLERLSLFASKSALIPEAQLQAGRAYLACDKMINAIDAVNFVLENYPTHPLRFEAYLLAAEIYGKQGSFQLAFNALNKVSGSRLEDDLAFRASLLKAELYANSGRYSQSDSLLTDIVKSGKTSDYVGEAAVRLAISLQHQGNYRQSLEIVQSQLTKKLPAATTARLQLILGDNYYLSGDLEQARQNYEKISKPELENKFQYGLDFRLGVVKHKLNRNNDAIVHFRTIVEDSLCTNIAVREKSLLNLAALLANAGHVLQASRLLQDKILDDNFNSFRDELVFELGNLLNFKLQDRGGARSSYAAITAINPWSRFLDDAQLAIARSYESENNLAAAVSEYRRFLSLFPGSDEFENVQTRLDILQKFAPASLSQLQQSFATMFAVTPVSLTETQRTIQLAKTTVHVFHDYPRALELLQQALAVIPTESAERAELVYYQAFCHSALMEKYIIENQPVKAAEQQSLLQQVIQTLRSQYPGNYWSGIAMYRFVKATLLTLDSPTTKIPLLESTLADMSDDARCDSLKYDLSMQLVKQIILAGDNSVDWLKLQKANIICSDVISKKLSPDIYAGVLFYYAHVLHRLGETDSAIVLLQKSIVLNNNTTCLDSKLLLADIYVERSQPELTMLLLQDIVDHYFYSRHSYAAKSRLIGLLMEKGELDKARAIINREMPAIPEELQPFYADPLIDEQVLWMYTQLNIDPANPLQTMSAFRNYLYNTKTGKYRGTALLALGDQAAAMNNREVAIGHYDEIIHSFPQDSLAQLAQVRKADMFYDRGMWVEARSQYNLIKNHLTGDLAVHASAREIVCDFKLDNVNRAKSLANDFLKKYPGKANEAQFLYEEGEYFVRQKEFEPAEKLFKNLAKKFSDMPEGAQGDLGLGRMYIITGKPDDALKILTQIPEKYKDPDVIATGYLYLATFYYENRLLAQCISACENVIKIQKPGLLHAQAMDFLIKCYDEFRLKDKAIATIRDYINLYPDSPDILTKKIQIGIFLYDLKDYERAISELKQLKPLVNAEEDPEVQYWIAKSYADKGDTEQAIVEFLKVKYLYKPTKLPWGVTALYEAGLAYRKLGNFSKAIELLSQVLRERGATDNIGRAAGERIKEIEQDMQRVKANG